MRPETETGSALPRGAGSPARIPLSLWPAVLLGLSAAGASGYLGARLLPTDQRPFRFVGVTSWSSPLMAFRARAATEIPYPSSAALYQPM